MSEEVLKEIAFFAAIIAVIFGLWLFTGGPHRASSQDGIFIKPLPPEGSGAIYDGPVIGDQPLATTTVKIPGLVPKN